MKFCRLLVGLFATCGWFASIDSVKAQVTAFTYQGSLSSNGAPANGLYAMQFKLRLPGNTQVGGTLTNSPVGVTNGLFTTQIDFGNVFSTNLTLYLEIGVSPYGSANAFIILSPTQLLTPVPYAEEALNASFFNGTLQDTQLSTNIAQLDMNETFGGTVHFTNAQGNFTGALAGTLNATGTFSGASSGTFTGTLIGNGGAVTNLNITNLVGVVQSNPNWQLVQGTNQTAVSGNNYLTTNAALSTLTLPAGPGVGSTVDIAGSGQNGFAVAQNAGQSIVTTTLGLPAGLLWTASSSASLYYQALACSANGLRVIAAVNSGDILYSSDGGHTWTQSTAPTTSWTGLASSADGMRLAAVVSSDHVYTSTNGGTNWVSQANSTVGTYKCIASSADGNKLAAAIGYGTGYIYTSTNAGLNWTATTNGNTSGIASSADGTKLYACSSNSPAQVYVSANSGNTWTDMMLGVNSSLSSIACSADGVHVVTTTTSTSLGGIYVSDDSGYSWTVHAMPQTWSSVTCSSNGIYMAATDLNGAVGSIYTSGDSGQTWVQRTNGYGAGQVWSAITGSADGTRLFAAIRNGVIYTAQGTTTVGTAGGLTGTQYSTLQLQYIGNGQWMPLNFLGSFSEY